jgi:hypothetical protein
MSELDRVKVLLKITDEAQDALLTELLLEAEEWIINYLYRSQMPEALRGVQVRLAAALYNRRGIEGMSAAKDGGISRTADALPEDIRRALNPYRVARTLG